MPRYIDVEDIKLKGISVFDQNLEMLIPLSDVRKSLQMTPTADVVEVVRCKDCKHYKEFRTKRNKQIMRLCCRMGKNDMEYPVKPYDFCSFGERRNEDAAD